MEVGVTVRSRDGHGVGTRRRRGVEVVASDLHRDDGCTKGRGGGGVELVARGGGKGRGRGKGQGTEVE